MTRSALLLLALLPWGLAAVAQEALPVEVAIQGVGGELRDAVLSNLSLQREAQQGPLAPLRIRYLQRRAQEEIASTLRAFGYYAPRIGASVERAQTAWRAVYTIDAGEPVRIADVDLQVSGEGAAARVFREWRRSFPLQPGQVLRHPAYEAAKADALRLAEEQGYLEAAFSRSVVEVDTETRQALVILHLVTGPRYRFGPLRFEPSALDEAFLRRYVPFARGEPYRTELVFALQRALINSDYFERVDVVPRVDDVTDGEVPVEVRLEMRKRNRYSFGVGYGTDTGPRLTAGFDRRWVNARGHRAGADLTVSGIGTSLRGNYRIPLASPSTDFLGFLTTWESEETDTATRETIDVGASLTRSLGKWYRTLGLNYQEEDFEVGGESARSRLVIPSAGWERVAARTRIFPESGWRLALGVKGAAKTLGSSTSLLQGQLRYKNIFPLLGGRVILRGDAGASETEEFDELPASLRFFAGGDQSVRGYAYQSLGPRNEEGDVVGGKFLLVGSAEYDRYVTDSVGWAVFVDTGNAFNRVDDYVLERGVGAGLRWKFPFGVLRLDVAAAVTRPGEPLRLHLTIGPEL